MNNGLNGKKCKESNEKITPATIKVPSLVENDHNFTKQEDEPKLCDTFETFAPKKIRRKSKISR